MNEGLTLLVKTHAFGDALMCTPAVRTLMEKKEGRYLVLAGPSSAPVWERIPGTEGIYVAPIPPGGPEGGLRLLKWTLANRKRFRKVKRSLVFQGSPSVRRWVRFLTGARMVSCGGKPLGDWERVVPMEPGDPAGKVYAGVAGVDVRRWRPFFPVRPAEKNWADGLGLYGTLFAVAPGGGRNPRDTVLEKRWSVAGYARVVEMLLSAGLNVVLLGGEGDRDVARALKAKVGNMVTDLVGKTTWGQAAAVLDRCRGFLGADSGTAHLATARFVPSVVLFGPSDPDALYPPGLVVPVRGRADCAPCYSNSRFPGCVGSRAFCMESITPDEVWHAVEMILRTGGDTRR